jgi:hypothetical protein
MTAHDAAVELASKFPPFGRRWSSSGLRSAIRNPKYKGVGAPAIVSEEEWAEANEELGKHPVRHQRRRRPGCADYRAMLKLWEARRAGRARPPRHQPVRTKS